MAKNKITLKEGMDIDLLLSKVEQKYKEQPHSTIDGLKIDFDKGWVHLRRSNTEPIIRIYSEGESPAAAEEFSNLIMKDVRAILGE